MAINMKLSQEDIERDRLKWMDIIHQMNNFSKDITYGLRQSEQDGYWYITAETPPEEIIHFKDEITPETQIEVRYSKKQFDNPYHSWIKNQDSNFILDMIPNNSKDINEFVGRFSYHPFEKEFLFGRISFAHADAIRQFGNYEFAEYQRGIYLKKEKVVLLRPYYNPTDEKGRFNEKWPEFDQQLNKFVTKITLDMLVQNGMPEGIKIVKDANNNIIKEYTRFV